MPDFSIEPVLEVSPTAAVAGGVARVLMVLQVSECRGSCLHVCHRPGRHRHLLD
jgi:hypothetical protein